MWACGCLTSWASDSHWRSKQLLFKTLLSISIWGQLCQIVLLLLYLTDHTLWWYITLPCLPSPITVSLSSVVVSWHSCIMSGNKPGLLETLWIFIVQKSLLQKPAEIFSAGVISSRCWKKISQHLAALNYRGWMKKMNTPKKKKKKKTVKKDNCDFCKSNWNI